MIAEKSFNLLTLQKENELNTPERLTGKLGALDSASVSRPNGEPSLLQLCCCFLSQAAGLPQLLERERHPAFWPPVLQGVRVCLEDGLAASWPKPVLAWPWLGTLSPHVNHGPDKRVTLRLFLWGTFTVTHGGGGHIPLGHSLPLELLGKDKGAGRSPPLFPCPSHHFLLALLLLRLLSCSSLFWVIIVQDSALSAVPS